jgi:hypothetical protein
VPQEIPKAKRTRLRLITGIATSTITVAIAGLVGAAPSFATPAGPARAADSYGWRVVNAPSTVALRNSPSWNDVGTLGGFSDGQVMNLQCYEFGGPVGPYNNTLWYYAADEALGGYTYGWVSDHYLNTPGTAAHPRPQTGPCHPTSGSGFVDYNYTGEIFSVVNAPNTVNWRNFPNWNYPVDMGFGNGDPMDLGCYMFGGPAGPYGNTLWYMAWDGANNTYGWINDHYLTTPGTAAHPQPQTWECNPSSST